MPQRLNSHCLIPATANPGLQRNQSRNIVDCTNENMFCSGSTKMLAQSIQCAFKLATRGDALYTQDVIAAGP